MFDRNVPEQVIKETTGHKSECVCVYKHTSEVLKEAASKTISGEKPVKQVKLDDDEDSDDVDFLPFSKMVENVKKTKEEMRKKLLPKKKVIARRLIKRAKKFTFDLNINLNVTK